MPIRIVFDHTGRQTTSYIARTISRIVGALLIAVGLSATVVAIPSGFVLIADVSNLLRHEKEQLFPPDFPLQEVELAFAAATLLAWFGLRYGRRIFRGHRSVVLFLRRFGYRGSMQAVTFAVATTIGVAWRLVTLDDAEIAPLGVDSATRQVFGDFERIARLVAAASRGVFVFYQWTLGGMLLVVALQAALIAPNWQRALDDGTLDPYAAIWASVMEGRVPIAYFGPTLPGAFAILATGVALCALGFLVEFVALLAAFPFFGFVLMGILSSDELSKAEESKTETISHQRDIETVVSQVSQRGHQTFASLLVVLRVATAFWQQTVTALAAVTSASIIDISEPTENLVWELEELERLYPGRCIVIGEHARIARWGDAASESFPAGSLDARIAQLLEGREVLAYTTDRKGMRRFAHALYGLLLECPRRI